MPELRKSTRLCSMLTAPLTKHEHHVLGEFSWNRSAVKDPGFAVSVRNPLQIRAALTSI